MDRLDFDRLCRASYTAEFMEMHAGESFEWVDAAAAALVDITSPSSIIDLGCGIGRWISAAKAAGCDEVLGVEYCLDEAIPFVPSNVLDRVVGGNVAGDLQWLRESGAGPTFDCVWSFEVAEHLRPEDTESFISNVLDLAERLVVLTAAPPGQGGVGHINCRPREYWIGAFLGCGGLSEEAEVTDMVRDRWRRSGAAGYMVNNLMIFRKE